MTTMKLITSLAILGAVSSLDVELEAVTCDESLPVTANFYLRCSDSSRCTFGKDTLVYGTCKLRFVSSITKLLAVLLMIVIYVCVFAIQ